jgi:prepilin-type N-terminal cleavage/methylation domain-containing protein
LERQSGFSLVELLVSLTLVAVIAGGLANMMIHSSRMNRSRQMTVDVHANARNCMTLIVQKLRSAGWDPMNAGVATVALDPDTSDDVSQIEVFADLDGDGLTLGDGEQVLIRHLDDRVVWRRTGNIGAPFSVLASHISNDADGDGTIEPMFVPDSTTHPTRITVRVTARSAVRDPLTREFLRYTLTSDVILRKSI